MVGVTNSTLSNMQLHHDERILMKSSISRIMLLSCPLILTESLIVVFAGVGYSILLLFLIHTVVVMSIYSPDIYILLFGKELYSGHANSLANVRQSRTQMLLLIFNGAVLLAAAVVIILIANGKLIDYI